MSPWGVAVYFMKMDESMISCINHRELNQITVKNKYPLLDIDNSFDQLRVHNYFPRLISGLEIISWRSNSEVSKIVFQCHLW